MEINAAISQWPQTFERLCVCLCDDSASDHQLFDLSQLSEVLVEMGSNLMQVENQILALAQREKRACSSIVYSLETLAWPQLHSHAQDFSMVGTINPVFWHFKILQWVSWRIEKSSYVGAWLWNLRESERKWDEENAAQKISCLSYTQVSRNIVMEAHLIRTSHFTGITCTVYQRRDVPTVSKGMEMPEFVHEQQLRFRCSTGSHNTSLNNFPLKVRHRHRLVCPGSFANVCLTFKYVLFSFLVEFRGLGLSDSSRHPVSSWHSCGL